VDAGVLTGNKDQITKLAEAFNKTRNIHSADYVIGEGFTGVYDSATCKFVIAPSRIKPTPAQVNQGWVEYNGGHLSLSLEMGGNVGNNHHGFAVILREGGLEVTWKSNTLNPNGLVPKELRPQIIKAIEEATGMKVIIPNL
jgi:hypothetical protein